ncbi:hypothetical protein N7481_001969 [Penicillium waksmanii]|uniref:uncharacterized protein n=1 Tax=Penicillium waksmanii TaxID=69791 RepID=UPI0025477270|nr:uncharacterized protein N7481_001969 [Penicillium waksmanii]KAJ5994992.1 hypothetical protein N7481_001969 [Penicillium waksmanii]
MRAWHQGFGSRFHKLNLSQPMNQIGLASSGSRVNSGALDRPIVLPSPPVASAGLGRFAAFELVQIVPTAHRRRSYVEQPWCEPVCSRV